MLDAAVIAYLAQENQAGSIVIGKSLNDDGAPTLQSRRADRLAEAIRQQCDLLVTTWDESFSTQEARHARILMKTSRKQRRGHLDDMAAVHILQSYLDARV
jgi:putative Holliday junction resolvase